MKGTLILKVDPAIAIKKEDLKLLGKDVHFSTPSFFFESLNN